ncbi:MAG TPA: hypothetical protein VL551_06320 [Actinospica sp.]|nr:hypothetical protein [Actinospica sp.]
MRLIRAVAATGAIVLAVVTIPTAGASASQATTTTTNTTTAASPYTALSPDAAVTSPHVARTSEAKTRAAELAYWTPQRLKNAKNGDALAPKQAKGSSPLANVGADSAAVTTPHKVGPVAGKYKAHAVAASRAAVSPALGTVTVTPSIGKVFFSVGGGDYACSASSVNSSSGELVITAGHCVYSVSAQAWSTNFVYIPAYANGNAPYGTWSGVSMATFAGFASSGDATLDTGYVAVSGPSNLVSTVGGNGVEAGYTSFSDPLFTMGYPSSSPENQAYCYATATINTSDGLVFMPCDQGPGASGSPILDNYDTSSGLGTLASDLTLVWSYSDGSTANSGPIWGDTQWNEYLSMGSVVV